MERIFNYVAGYIDGDGCFYIGKFKQKNITAYEQSLQIISVKEKVLHEFMDKFGGAIRKKPSKVNHRDAFCWTIKGIKSVNLANKIKPYLVEKINQCNIYINFITIVNRNNFQKVSEDIINQRNYLIEEIRKDKHMSNHITKEEIEKLKDAKNTITPTETDYPYLAGLIDAEGCFRIKKWKPKNRPNNVYNINVEIGNTKLPIMPWLIKRFGGSVIFIPTKGTKKASATWTLSAASLYNILPKIRPHLRSKQIICDKLIEFQETILSNGGDRHSELFRALFEKRLEIREKIVKEIHDFNKKGC